MTATTTSPKATRDHFGVALADVAENAPHVTVVNCDLASATKTTEFKRRFPDRFLECGIAEANAIGIAAGLAQEGHRPFVASFGHFLTGKYLEIFQSIGLNDAGVVLVGTHAGLAIGKDGPTQMGLRDLSLMRTLPNVEVLHPADGIETRQMLDYLVGSDRPAYLRLCRQPQAEVHDEHYRFAFGRPDVVEPGHRGDGAQDVVVFTMGGMVRVVLDALPLLAEHGLRPTVVNVSSLPLDQDALRALLAERSGAFVVEDHYVVGGLADELAALVLRSGLSVRFGALGVSDYGQAGSPDELYERYGLDAAGIAEAVRRFVVVDPTTASTSDRTTATTTGPGIPAAPEASVRDLVEGLPERRYVFAELRLPPGASITREATDPRTYLVTEGTIVRDPGATGSSASYGRLGGWHVPAHRRITLRNDGRDTAVVLEAGSVAHGPSPDGPPGDCVDVSGYRVDKPWGHEIWYTHNLAAPAYALKQIHMTSGHQSSLQSHTHKTETNFVIEGEATVLNGEPAPLDTSAVVDASTLPRTSRPAGTGWTSAPGILHRVIARATYTAIEVSTPELDDVVRWADDTNRGSGRIDSEHRGGPRTAGDRR